MSLIPPKGKSAEPAPKGNHVARLYQVVRLGTQQFSYMGEAKESDKVRLTFELCNKTKVFKEGEPAKPIAVSREFGYFMSQKANLRKFVEGFTGVALTEEEAGSFDLEQLVGEACLLNIVHETREGQVYANIQGATPLIEGMTAPAMVNAKSVIDGPNASEEVLNSLPEFLQKKIRLSKEYMAKHNRVSPDDIPF